MAIQKRVAIAAATTEPNLITGDIFQFLRRDSRIQFGIVKEFGNADKLTYTLTIGDAIAVKDAPIKAEDAAIQRGVNINSDLSIPEVGRAGDSLGLSVTNPAAATIVDVEFLIIIS